MKNIVICCDGTGNDFGDELSNVVKLFSVLNKDPSKQVVYYDPGVGTPSTYSSFNPITKKIKYFFGQGFGYGLTGNVMDAYRFLMEHYEEGDRVYLFGFSRGSYTIRVIAGFLHKCGLLYANNQNLIPEAMRIYKGRNNWPLASKFRKTFGRSCPVHFLGLWDTVTSVGWVWDPVTLDSTTRNPSVVNVRHAISVDERRAFFRQNLWKSHRRAPDQDIKQVWFAGVHSDVGGSYPLHRSALSNIALEWMLVEAKDKGMLIGDLEKARAIIQDISNPYTADQSHSLKGFWYICEIWPKWVKVPPGKFSWKPSFLKKDPNEWGGRPYINLGRRRLLEDGATLHDSVFKRLEEREDYRPSNLLKGRKISDLQQYYGVEKWVRL